MKPEIIGYIRGRGWDQNNLSQEQLDVINLKFKIQNQPQSQSIFTQSLDYHLKLLDIENRKKKEENKKYNDNYNYNDEFWEKRRRDDNNAYCPG